MICRGSARRLLQGAEERRARCLHRGYEADGHADDRGDCRREEQHACVDVNRADARQPRWAEGDDRAHADDSDGHAKRRTEHRQHHTLREHLTREASGAGAECDAHGELAASLRGAREQEIRQHSAEHREQRRFDAARDVVLQRHDAQGRLHVRP